MYFFCLFRYLKTFAHQLISANDEEVSLYFKNVVSDWAKCCEVKAFSPFEHFCFECQYDKAVIKCKYNLNTSILPYPTKPCMIVCFCSYWCWILSLTYFFLFLSSSFNGGSNYSNGLFAPQNVTHVNWRNCDENHGNEIGQSHDDPVISVMKLVQHLIWSLSNFED